MPGLNAANGSHCGGKQHSFLWPGRTIHQLLPIEAGVPAFISEHAIRMGIFPTALAKPWQLRSA
jgi:hypothetical protein